LAVDGKLAAEAQDEALTNYAPLLSKEDGRVDWAQDAVQIDRQIRALNPWPGVWTLNADGVRLKIIAAEPVVDKSDAGSGKLIDKAGHVVCGNGSVLKLQRVQPDNGKPMDVASAINGGYLVLGGRFQ
jgi:methionyl-tRNA formyltransferase